MQHHSGFIGRLKTGHGDQHEGSTKNNSVNMKPGGSHIHIYIYVCMYVCVYIYIYIYIHLYIYMYIQTHIYLYMYVHMQAQFRRKFQAVKSLERYTNIPIYVYLNRCRKTATNFMIYACRNMVNKFAELYMAVNPFKSRNCSVQKIYKQGNKSIHKIYGADIYGMGKSKSRNHGSRSQIQIRGNRRGYSYLITHIIIGKIACAINEEKGQNNIPENRQYPSQGEPEALVNSRSKRERKPEANESQKPTFESKKP